MNDVALNIRRLRTSKGWTQSELAKQAGLSRPTISNIEDVDALNPPSGRTLKAVADALGVNVPELFRHIKLPSHVRFRALTQFKSREQVLADALRAYEHYRQLEKAAEDELHGRYQLHKLRKDLQNALDGTEGTERAQEAARFIRKQLDIDPSAALPSITYVIEQLGVRVISMPYNHPDAFGLSFISSEGFPVIVVNMSERITVERWIFSAAHELGHLLLHYHDDLDFSQTDEIRQEEQEANSFAAELLMPRQGFLNLWNMYAESTLLDSVLEIKRRFVVSYQSVLVQIAQDRTKYKEYLQKFHTQYELRYGTKLTATDEAEEGAHWSQYDSWVVPAALTSQEPENVGAGAPRINAFFPQGRAMKLLITAIQRCALEEEDVAEILYTSRKVANSFIMRVRGAEW